MEKRNHETPVSTKELKIIFLTLKDLGALKIICRPKMNAKKGKRMKELQVGGANHGVVKGKTNLSCKAGLSSREVTFLQWIWHIMMTRC